MPLLDDVNYAPRSFIRDLKPWQGHKDWSEALLCYKHMAQVSLFPNILWLLLCCGAFLGVYVLYASEFSTILTAPPYNFSFQVVGAVMAGQIIVCFVFIPAIGYGTDILLKYLCKKNGGVIEVCPSFRISWNTELTLLGRVSYAPCHHPMVHHHRLVCDLRPCCG